MPSLSEPCPYKYAKDGKHKIRGNMCRHCGARDESAPVNHTLVALDLAEKRFREASLALDSVFGRGASSEERHEYVVAWRTALSALLAAEKEAE
jgi:hypothetical protein